VSFARSAALAEADVAHQVDELAEALLVEAGAGVVLGQHALERGVVALDGGHRVVDELADGGLRAFALRCASAPPSAPRRCCGAVLVGILGVGALRLLRLELGVLLLEGVGDVLEEDQAEDDVLVLGRVHVVAQRVGGRPELGLEAEGLGCRDAMGRHRISRRHVGTCQVAGRGNALVRGALPLPAFVRAA
jgi:hypothetical protein